MRYTGRHREVAFALGGMGTGCVSLGVRGELRDWEIFNRPGKGNDLPCTFFCIRYRAGDEPARIRVLEAAIPPPYSGSNGWRTGRVESPSQMGGLPRFAHSDMTVEYPFARVRLWDEEVPFSVELEAFTPFIPLNLKDSSIPCAIFSWRVVNTGAKPLAATVAATLLNCVGYDGGEPRFEQIMGNENRLLEGPERTALFFTKPGQDPALPEYGSLALCAEGAVSAKPEWVKGQWWDCVQEFWDDLLDDGLLRPARAAGVGSSLQAPPLTIGSLAVSLAVAPGAEGLARIALGWHFPNRIAGWWQNQAPMPVVQNHYASYFADAAQAAAYALAQFERLRGQSALFARALCKSCVPAPFRLAAMRNLTAMRSPTVFVIEKGRFMGWEGCNDRAGSCHGTCTHVYNYAQSMAALFPMLERSAREAEFTDELDGEGAMAFRGQTGFGWERWHFQPAIDGQFGAVVRLCREWRRCGDDEWLKQLWPGARRALDFGLAHWDPDEDGLPEARQHNTYDIEFYGPNPLGAGMMLAALTAGLAMAEAMGDAEAMERWRERLSKGARAMEETLFNGEYYAQPLQDESEYKYQPGAGCLSDQLMGQFMADCAGLGDLLRPEHMRSALAAVVRHNFITDFAAFPALHRTYALPGEEGLVLCTWPRGRRPKMPMPYSDEVWTGVEYEAAALLVKRGMVREAERIVRAVNRRHDGIRRNPFNEAECGHHYARSMASWALLDACSGFVCDLPNNVLSFAPVAPGRYLFACQRAWGQYEYLRGVSRVLLYGGELDGVGVRCPGRFAGIVPGV